MPSWIDKWPDARPGVNESGTTFATRMMNKKYGVGGWERTGQQGMEFSQLKKFCTTSKDLTKHFEEEGDYSSDELVDALLWCVGAVTVKARIL